MKITAVWGLICLFLLFSCKKDNVVPDTTPAPLTTTATSNTTTSNSANNGNTNTATTTPGSTNTATPGTATSGPAAATTTGTGTSATGSTTGGATAPATTGATSTSTTKSGTTTPATTPTTTTTKTTTTPAPTPAPAPTVAPTTLAGVYGDGTHDDTQALQALLNAGNVTLAAGKTYKIGGLKVPYSFNLNGSTLMVSGSSNTGVMLTGTGSSVTNGYIKGNWSYTSPGNPNGGTGMSIKASNCSISHIGISSFAGYGILVGPYNNASVTYCNIQATGYIAFYFDAETSNTGGGIFSNNAIDRSMLPASTVSELAIGIRGSTSNSSLITSNWTVSNNTIKMPYLPTDWTAECIEIRNCANTTLSNNTLVAGSIGISVVRSSGITLSGNSFSNSQLEAIEFGDSNSCISKSNIINGTNGVGIQIDGAYGSSNINILNDIISNTKNECIHAYIKTESLTISGCKLTTPSGAKGVNLQQSNNVIIKNNTFIGNSVANVAVMLDTCPGNVSITGGTVSNFKYCVVTIYSAKSGLVTNNVTMSGVSVSGVPTALSTILSNGATVGSNVVVTL